MKTILARYAKYVVVPVFAIAVASGGSALVGAHGSSGDHRSAAGVTHAKDSTAPNKPLKPSPAHSASASPEAHHQVARFHGDATSCPTPEGVTLKDNWTHGDYVSAWAKTGDSAKTQTAAQSDCGKPQSSVDNSKSKDGDETDEGDDGPDHASAHRQDGEHRNDHSDGAGDDHGQDDD